MLDLERPFHRLIHHFVFRIFHGAGEGDELQFSIPALIGIISVPAAFFSISLFGKYSTLMLYLMRRPQFDVYRASIPDEHFFIVFSMTVTGAIVIAKWDRLFPDRQDYDNLAALPVSTRQIFQAALAGLLFLAGLFAVDLNLAACFIFPLAVTAVFNTFEAYRTLFVAHAAAVILASFFACFGLLSVMGATVLLAPRRYVRIVSLAVRISCALALVAVLASAFSLPRLLLSAEPPKYLAYIPSVWFLDLQQVLLGRSAAYTGSGMLAVEITAGLFVLSLVLYALTYHRLFTRIPETNAVNAASGRDAHSLLRRFLDCTILRTPFQRAAYHFSCKTLFRSEQHCLLFGAATGIGFFVAAQYGSDALTNSSRVGLDHRLLAVPLVLSYFIICTLRVLFDLPTESKANWLFRSIVDRRQNETRVVGTKVIVMMIAPWLIVIGLPLHVLAWGWSVAFLHTGYVLLCSTTLASLLLTGYRKIPFTCLHTASKDHVLIMFIVFWIGLWFFGPLNSMFEWWFIQEPFRFLYVLPLFAALFYGVRTVERDLHEMDRTLIYEDRPSANIQLLNLTK